MSIRPHFGVCLPQFGTSWNQAREVAQAADEAGFDSVWCVDHFVGIPFEKDSPFEFPSADGRVSVLSSNTLLCCAPSMSKSRRKLKKCW